MKKILEKLNDYRLPINVSHLALAFSLLAVGFVASSVNTPCLQAQATCASGGNSEFTGNISVKGGTSYKATFDASGITADRTLTIPNAGGTLALTSDIPSIPSLTADKVMATDGTGAYTTTDVYPLTLTASKSLSTDGSGNVETNDVYPLTLTASTPLKTNGTGEVTASDLDITTDITPGAALTQIRTNAAGNALEFFTPAASGGAYTLIDSGTVIARTSSLDEVFTCWFGNTLDGTKRYKLIFDGGTGWNVGGNGYTPSYRPLEGDCSTGTKNEWESNSYYQTSGHTQGSYSGNTGDWRVQNTNKCYFVQGQFANTASLRTNNIQGYLTFSAFDNGNGYGLWSEGTASGIVGNGSGTVQGQQNGDWSCIVMENSSYTNSFADITGFQWYFEGGYPAPLTRSWALYEINY